MLFDTPADNPSETTEPAAAATPAATPDPKANPEAIQETDLETETPDPDEAEEELEGVKLRGKKELLEKIKTERLLHGDYTRKTMSLADERKSLESDRESFKQTTQLHQAFMKEAAQLSSVDERLQQFQRLDWNALVNQDASQAQRLQIEFTQLQAARGQLQNSLTQKQQQMQLAQQQETAKLASQAQAFLMRELKDWSPEKDRQMESYARGLGINTQQLGNFMLSNPVIGVLIDKAMRLDQLEKQRVTAKPKAEPPPKPVTRVGGAAASNTKSPSDMSPAEYAAWRRERQKR